VLSRKYAAITLTIGALLAPLASGSAQASGPAAQWRISVKFSDAQDQPVGLAAQSPRSAWAFVIHRRGTPHPSAFYLRWQGHGWRRVQVPHPATFLPEEISSSSPANVWILGDTTSSPTSPSRDYALIFNGSTWHTMTAPVIGTLAVGSPSNAWIYVGPYWTNRREISVHSEMYRWDGRKWTEAVAPTYGLGLSVSGRRTWLAGTTKVHFEDKDELGVTRPRLYSFSAGAWHPASPAGPEAVIATDTSAAAVSPAGNVWLPARAKHGTGGRILQYRFGTWKSVTGSGTKPGFPIGPIIFDGSTGFWDTWLHWTGSHMVSTEDVNQRFALYLFKIVPIPHSTSAWALATVGNEADFAIARYVR
jgi:hypothetical protein